MAMDEVTATVRGPRPVMEPWVTVLPEGFRFAEINPASGVPYAASRYADLPPYATREVPVPARQWDDLVAHGEAGYLVEPTAWFSLFDVHEAARRRAPMHPPSASGVCGDCWGTGVGIDIDGSCTGARGTVIWCWCCDTAAARRWVAQSYAPTAVAA